MVVTHQLVVVGVNVRLWPIAAPECGQVSSIQNEPESSFGGRLFPAESVGKVAASPCRWKNFSVSEHEGQQYDGAVTGRTAAPALLGQPARSRPGPTSPAQH